MKNSQYFAVLCLSLLVPGLAIPPIAAEAASPKPAISAPQKLSLNFKPPKRGAPRATAGGATRGACTSGAKSITPLTPKGQVGLTVTERPSFFAYIPQSRGQTAEFLLLSNDDTEVVYQTTFTLPSKAGVLRFDLPADAPTLKPGQEYHWFITLNCDLNKGPSGNPTIEGWIERLEPNSDLKKALTTAKPDERPAVLAEAGIWHDTLAALANLRRTSPNNVKLSQDWRTLLQSVGLDAIATEPLVECCLAKN